MPNDRSSHEVGADITGSHERRRSDSVDSIDNLDELDPLYEVNTSRKHEETRQYEDLSSIDWIQEFARERRRKNILQQDTTLNGRTIRVLDQAQTWVIIAVTGMAVGVLSATIDSVSMWLGDLKEGHCSGAFHRNQSFCCWGLTADDVCDAWRPWSVTLGASAKGSAYLVNYLTYCFSAVVFAATASFLVTNYAPYASHSGIPEIKVMLSGVVIKKFLGKVTLLVKSLGLCLAVSSGLWLGKEGPLVHVATCCGSIVLKFFPAVRQNEARKREIFSAAAAAGMSCSFGSPIGGVLFALEQISYYFPDRSMWQSFVCAMISSVAFQFMNPFRTGRLVLYQVVFDRDWHKFELVPFVFLGIVGGLYGAYFIRLNRAIQGLRQQSWFATHSTLEVALLTVITSVISFPNVFTRIPQSRVLTDLLQECSQGNWLDLCTPGHLTGSVLLLCAAVVLGSLLTAVTFGAKIPAGVILPSMTVGAALGRAVGMLVQHAHRTHPDLFVFSTCVSETECVTPGVYAIIGAAAALSGVTRMTVSLVVIMFELTGALTYVLPLMVATMTSKFVADTFGKQGIYEAWIEMQNYPYLSKDEDLFYGTKIADVMIPTPELQLIDASEKNTIGSMRELLRDVEHTGFPVVSSLASLTLVGYIRVNDVRHALSTATHLADDTPVSFCAGTMSHAARGISLRHKLDDTPFVLATQTSIRLVADLFQKLGLQYVFVGREGRLLGMISRHDLLRSQTEKSQSIDSDELSSSLRGFRMVSMTSSGTIP